MPPPSPLPRPWEGAVRQTESVPSQVEVASPQSAAVPRRDYAHEVIWKQRGSEALTRARVWASDGRTPPRGLVPRIGRAALVEPRPRPDDWWLEGRAETVTSLRGSGSLIDDDAAALRCPAVVLTGMVEVATSLGDELTAIRAAVRHLRTRHKTIREALELTGDIEAERLTPNAVIRTGIDEVVRAAVGAGMSAEALKRTARHSLLRARRYREVNLFGCDHVVLWWRGAAAEPQIAYVPTEAAAAFPLVLELEARAVVTVHPRQDPEETSRLALRVHALARRLSADELGEPLADGSSAA